MSEPSPSNRNTPWLTLFLASNAGLGYAPVASGTFGTLMGIPCYYLISRLNVPLQALALLVVILLSCKICDLAGQHYQEPDDGRIVIDELAGYLVTTAFLPFSWGIAIAGFFCFRLFDICKPFPASWFDREWKNGLGVTLDDVVAGIYALILLRLGLALFG